MAEAERQKQLVKEALGLADRLYQEWWNARGRSKRNYRLYRLHQKAVARWERRDRAYRAIPVWQQTR